MDQGIIENIIKSHKLLKSVDQIQTLNKGQSPEKKYILFSNNQEKFILRVAKIGRFHKYQKMFNIINKFHKKGVKCLKPVVFDKTADDRYCYSVVEYLQGKSSESILPNLSTTEQLKIGIAAGKELKKLHKLKCPKTKRDWFDKRYPKFLADLKKFKDLKLSFYKEKYVLDYINKHVDLMKGRPLRFLHYDYGVRNIIVHNNKLNGIIDFNGYKWGDPIHDFYKLPWGSKNCSVWFVKGEIIGYNGGSVPDSFWAMYNLYVMMNLHRRLAWAYLKQPSRFPSRLKIIEEIVREHNLKSNKGPKWFNQRYYIF